VPHLRIVDVRFLVFDVQLVLVVAELDLGGEANDGLQTQRIEFDRLDTRAGKRLDLLLLHGFGDHLGQEYVESFFDNSVAADHALDHRARRFTTTEAGHVDAARQTTECVVHGTVEPFWLNLDGQRNLARRQLRRRDLHADTSSFSGIE